MYPVERVFLAENHGKHDQVYAVRGTAEAKRSGTEMIMFDTPMIDCGSKMTAFVFETVNFASSIID